MRAHQRQCAVSQRIKHVSSRSARFPPRAIAHVCVEYVNMYKESPFACVRFTFTQHTYSAHTRARPAGVFIHKMPQRGTAGGRNITHIRTNKNNTRTRCVCAECAQQHGERTRGHFATENEDEVAIRCPHIVSGGRTSSGRLRVCLCDKVDIYILYDGSRSALSVETE